MVLGPSYIRTAEAGAWCPVYTTDTSNPNLWSQGPRIHFFFQVLPVKSQDKEPKSFVSALISFVKQLTAKLEVQWLLILSGTWTWYFLFKKYLLISFYVYGCFACRYGCVWRPCSAHTAGCQVLEGPPGSSWIDSCKCPPPSQFHLPLFLVFTSPVIQL